MDRDSVLELYHVRQKIGIPSILTEWLSILIIPLLLLFGHIM